MEGRVGVMGSVDVNVDGWIGEEDRKCVIGLHTIIVQVLAHELNS